MPATQDNVLEAISALPYPRGRPAVRYTRPSGRQAIATADGGLCSSFQHESAQMALLDRRNVKAVPSHIQRTA